MDAKETRSESVSHEPRMSETISLGKSSTLSVLVIVQRQPSPNELGLEMNVTVTAAPHVRKKSENERCDTIRRGPVSLRPDGLKRCHPSVGAIHGEECILGRSRGWL